MSSQGVPSVSSAEVAIASGILGAGVGYVLAPRKYNLEQLITQQPDVFEKSISKVKMAKDGNDVTQEAYKLVQNARRDYMAAVAENAAEAKLVELSRAPSLASAYNKLKSFIPKAKTQYSLLIGALAAFATVVINYVTDTRS